MSSVRLGDVLELRREQVAIEPFDTYVSIGVRGFGRGIFHYEPKPGNELGRLRFFRVRPHELVVSNIKAWEGAIALSGSSDEGTVASNRFLTYTGDPDTVDLSFVRHLLLSDLGLPLVQRASPGSADRNRTLAIERFEAIEIPLPDIDEQRRIATHLDLVNEKARRTAKLYTRSCALRNASRSSLLRPPENGPANPSGWRKCSMADLVTLDLEPVEVLSEPSFRLIGVLSFGRGVLDRGELLPGDTKYKVLHRMGAGQIVMSRLKAWEGALAIVPSNFDGAVASTEFPTFTINRDVERAFVGALIRDPGFWSSLSDSSKGVGARRERVSADRFLAAEVWVPDRDVQRVMTPRLDSLQVAEELENGREQVLDAVFPAALNRAFADLT